MHSSTGWTPFSTVGIADDMIIWDEEVYWRDHEKHLTAFLQVTRPHHLKLSLDKIQLNVEQARHQ